MVRLQMLFVPAQAPYQPLNVDPAETEALSRGTLDGLVNSSKGESIRLSSASGAQRNAHTFDKTPGLGTPGPVREEAPAPSNDTDILNDGHPANPETQPLLQEMRPLWNPTQRL